MKLWNVPLAVKPTSTAKSKSLGEQTVGQLMAVGNCSSPLDLPWEWEGKTSLVFWTHDWTLCSPLAHHLIPFSSSSVSDNVEK